MAQKLRLGVVYDFRNPPESGMRTQDLYAAVMDQVVLLDSLGLDLAWFTEHHFVEDGYFEGRLPFPMKVDERWYMTQYPDVADSVRRGILQSAQAHFDEDGYREGRLPYGM